MSLFDGSKSFQTDRNFRRYLIGAVLCLAVLWTASAIDASPFSSSTIQGTASGQTSNGDRQRDSIQRAKRDLSQSGNFERFLGELQTVSRDASSDPMTRLMVLEAIADGLYERARESAVPNSLAMAEFALETTGHLLQASNFNGSGELETSYRTAVVLAALAGRLFRDEPQMASEIFLKSGAVTRGLYQNARYPAQARGGLAPLLLNEARGFAIRGNHDATLRVVKESLAWGLVEFQSVLEDPFLKTTTVASAIETEVLSRRAAYRESIQPGIKSAIAGFEPFAFDFSSTDVDQNRFAKSHFSGDFLIIDLWGTWCQPCRAAIPHLNQLQTEMRGQDLKIVGIAIEQGESEAERRQALADFLMENELSYQCLVGDESLVQQLPNFKSYPTMLFLDRQGNVRFATSGYLDYEQLSVIAEQLITLKPLPSQKLN
jgi:thiol-disulfide isomerase/thioredoxin